MTDTILLMILIITLSILFLYWYSSYSSKPGFALDENKNQIPDSWEKYQVFFRFKNFIILILGVAIGFLLY